MLGILRIARALAASSRRDADQLRLGCVRSIAAMPDDEMTGLLDAEYPDVARAAPRGLAVVGRRRGRDRVGRAVNPPSGPRGIVDVRQ